MLGNVLFCYMASSKKGKSVQVENNDIQVVGARVHNLKELSMGMSNDYECAISNGATFVRIGSKIFSSN